MGDWSRLRWGSGFEGQRKPDLGDGTFLNPLISGDHPDPSILRDGSDYYLTFSSFDAYPGLKVRGHVLTIGAGTGSEFSVLPAQNATGNWVKVTQRVPVRIAFDEKPTREMIAGLSADVKVITSNKAK